MKGQKTSTKDKSQRVAVRVSVVVVESYGTSEGPVVEVAQCWYVVVFLVRAESIAWPASILQLEIDLQLCGLH